MRTIIGEYAGGHLQPGLTEHGEDLPAAILQELKGRFFEEYREANLRLTAQQLKGAATADQDLIQAIQAFEALERVQNTLGKYLGEWYGLHHPEAELSGDALLTAEVLESGLSDMTAGQRRLAQTHDALRAYVEQQAQRVLPNMTSIAGALLSAKLLACAGSLARLAKMPSTTIQLLGAEQALFRHLRNPKALPPKHGLIISHPLLQATSARGRMARILANALALAARIDFYRGEYAGDELKNKVEVQSRALARSKVPERR